MMRCITLTQPWATLVAIGAKKIETRSWLTSYRGPLAIHAATGLGLVGGKRGYKRLCFTEPFLSVLSLARQNRSDVFYLMDYFMSLPMGAIVAVCELRGCVATEDIVDSGQAIDGDVYTKRVGTVTHTTFIPYPERRWDLTDQERAFGDYSPGRYAWLLADIRALPEPIACKGALGLWDWDGEL